MMKILKPIFIVMMLFIFAGPVCAQAAQSPIHIYINDELIQTNPSPYLSEGRTLVPLRVIAENLNTTVQWHPETSKISITDQYGKNVELIIGSKTALITQNGQSNTVALDAAPAIKEGRTMVPLRFIGEQLSAVVGWNDATNSVSINKGIKILNKPSMEYVDVLGTQVELEVYEGWTLERGVSLLPAFILKHNSGANLNMSVDILTEDISLNDYVKASIEMLRLTFGIEDIQTKEDWHGRIIMSYSHSIQGIDAEVVQIIDIIPDVQEPGGLGVIWTRTMPSNLSKEMKNKIDMELINNWQY